VKLEVSYGWKEISNNNNGKNEEIVKISRRKNGSMPCSEIGGRNRKIDIEGRHDENHI